MTEESAAYAATETPLEQQLAMLRSELYQLQVDHDSSAHKIDHITVRLQRLQDANLAPMLESSAVLVELRRIADSLEAKPRRVVVHYDQQEAAPQPCDCDELWRLAREFVTVFDNPIGIGNPPYYTTRNAFADYVREHS